MNEDQIIEILDQAWELEDGYFYKIRSRKFDKSKGNIIFFSLAKFSLVESDSISRRLVRLLWYIPIFLEYQKNTLKPVLSDEEYLNYVKISNKIQNEVERLLGYP